jgi:hypothetical protein
VTPSKKDRKRHEPGERVLARLPVALSSLKSPTFVCHNAMGTRLKFGLRNLFSQRNNFRQLLPQTVFGSERWNRIGKLLTPSTHV